MNKIILPIFAFLFFISLSGVRADLYWDYDQFAPIDGFSVSNGTLLNFSATLIANGTSEINGTLCITVNVDTNYGACGSVVEGIFIAGIDVFYVPNTIGSFFWRANYTHNDSTVFYSNTRNYNVILTSSTLIPIYPINSENVVGDGTNFMVNYTVDVYFPSDIHSDRYVYFYAYSDYQGSPLFSSETLICEYRMRANDTNPIQAGIHRIGCENYMYDNTGIYEELPSFNPKYWRAKLRVLAGEVDGANLLSDTGFQKYNYRINTNLANVFPFNNAVLCDGTIFIWNLTIWNIEDICYQKKSWHNLFIPFTSYLNDSGCGGGNLTINIYNSNNVSEISSCTLGLLPNNTIDYFECGASIPTRGVNTTYLGSYVAKNMLFNTTYNCNNGSIYQTSNSNLWYIISIAVANATNISSYPTYPLPINMSAFMPSLSTYWTSAFNTTQQGGLMFIAIFFILVMAILVVINADVLAGLGIFIYGMMVFTRIGYMPIVIMWLSALISGLLFVYLIRKFLMTRFG